MKDNRDLTLPPETTGEKRNIKKKINDFKTLDKKGQKSLNNGNK